MSRDQLDLAATEAALATSVAAFPAERDVLDVTGPDAVVYLQGQLSQDIEALAVGATAWSFLLAPTGKVDGWFRVSRLGPAHVRLTVDAGHGPAILARLERFKLRTDATIEARTAGVLAIRGPGTNEALNGLAEAVSAVPEAVIVPALWPGLEGVDLFGVENFEAEGLAVPVGDPSAEEAARIVAGVPKMGADISSSTIPNELGVVDRSVSFTKGCYVGQELVARVDSRGNNTPRTLMVATLQGSGPDDGARAATAPSVDTENLVGAELLLDDGASAGVVTSVAQRSDGSLVALASIRRGVEPGSVVHCELADRRWRGSVESAPAADGADGPLLG